VTHRPAEEIREFFERYKPLRTDGR
jgi:hypothetical protein